MARFRFLPGLALTALAATACTPIGVWLYQEPRVSLDEIRLQVDADTAPFGVVLAMRNPNDFPITVQRVEMTVTFDGRRVGTGRSEDGTTLPDRETRQLSLPVDLDGGSARALQTMLARGRHRYEVAGRAVVTTPIGERRVPFVIKGLGSFGTTETGGSTPAKGTGDLAANDLSARR